MLQNGVRILAFDGFKRMSSVIKYQDFMPDPSDARPIKGREYFLPLGKRRAHSPQTVLLENFPC